MCDEPESLPKRHEPRFMDETRIDVYRCGISPVVSGIRLTHLPTGIVVEGETDGKQTQMALKAELADKLGRKLSEDHPCELSRSDQHAPIAPVPVEETGERPEPRLWQYRVC